MSQPSHNQHAAGPKPQRQAVLYARVSSKEQERGGFSIPAQQSLLRRYATEQGLTLTAEFVDVETAGKAGRAAFGAMLKHIQSRRTRTPILVEKTDRLYRNLKDWVTLDDLDVEVHLVKEHVILSEESVSSEKFVHGIKVLMAQNFYDNLSEETKKGLQEKVRQGYWPARAPIGYQNILGRNGKRGIAPDAERGPIITQLFAWYARGDCSLTEVTARARRAGLLTRKSNKPVPRSLVHSILRNPIYMGEFKWKGARYPGVHQPLVPRDQWETVQDLLSGRAPRRKQRKRRTFTFSGLIQCGACADDGRRFRLIGEIKKERYVYYRCEGCKRRRQADYVKEETLIAAYVEALERVELGSEVHRALLLELGQCHADSAKTVSSNAERLRAEARDLEHRLDLAYDDRLAGRIDPAYFDRRAEAWHRRLEAIRREIQSLLEPSPTSTRTSSSSRLELPQPAELFSESTDPLLNDNYFSPLTTIRNPHPDRVVDSW